MIRAPVAPKMLRWARERAGLGQEALTNRFKKLPAWEAEDDKAQPTLKQVEAFARAVHVPVGILLLREPPQESLPIADFRTLAGQAVTHPSPDLLETIHTCQERQRWYRDFARASGQREVGFVASATVREAPEAVAARMGETLDFALAHRRPCTTWTDALRLFIHQAEERGVLVMVSGVVGSNNHRRLKTAEFRGFALCDRLAPLIFINGADTKAAQMFTLAHELAHLWLGASALSNSEAAPNPGGRREETWCNAVAAELLAPLDAVQAELQPNEALPSTLQRLARTFKVSRLVILRRLLDAGWIDRHCFNVAWEKECSNRQKPQGSSGGDFYRTTLVRVGKRFARSLVLSTLEGQTLYRDAFHMLGVSKATTFNELGRVLGVVK